MKRSGRIVVGILGASLALFLFGFVLFATSVTRTPDNGDVKGDAIVVLTGGPDRIAEAARLLAEGRGKRLLISGVNAQTGPESLLKLTGLDSATFDCCVDLGYAAYDTIGNARETRHWAEKRGFKRLVIVTASYHMPRSLAELKRAMPSVDFVPYAVVAKDAARRRPWWLEPRIANVLAREYVKFLSAAGRLMAERALGSDPQTAAQASGGSAAAQGY